MAISKPHWDDRLTRKSTSQGQRSSDRDAAVYVRKGGGSPWRGWVVLAVCDPSKKLSAEISLPTSRPSAKPAGVDQLTSFACQLVDGRFCRKRPYKGSIVTVQIRASC